MASPNDYFLNPRTAPSPSLSSVADSKYTLPFSILEKPTSAPFSQLSLKLDDSKRGESDLHLPLHRHQHKLEPCLKSSVSSRTSSNASSLSGWWALDSLSTWRFLRTGVLGTVCLIATIGGWIAAFSRHRNNPLPDWLHAVFFACVVLELYYVYKGISTLYLPYRQRQLRQTDPASSDLRVGEGGKLEYTPSATRRWLELALGLSAQTIYPQYPVVQGLPPYDERRPDGDVVDVMVERAVQGGVAPSYKSMEMKETPTLARGASPEVVDPVKSSSMHRRSGSHTRQRSGGNWLNDVEF